jgi:glycolate oxidase iron-sulfur subunit
MARLNIEVFESAKVEFVVSDAAGCSVQLKRYGHLLGSDPNFAERAHRIAAGARDSTELLAGLIPLRGIPSRLETRVAYDDPCHLVHGQAIRDEPRRLLKSVPGLQFVELPESDWCCGSAGTYNLTHVAESDKLLRRKMEHVRRVAPDILATANTGCMLQLAKGVREAHLNIQVRHVVEILAESYLRPT